MRGRSGAIGRSVALQIAVRVVAMVASVITVTIATRYLGIEDYGLLATAIVFVGLFESLTELGINPVIIRRVANGRGTLSRLVGLNLGFSLFFAPVVAVTAAGAGLVVYRHDAELQIATAIVASGLLFTALSTCWDPVYEVHLRFGPVALADGASRVLTLGATWLVATMDYGLLAMAAVQVTPMVVRFLITVVTAPRLERTPPVLSRREIVDLVRECLPFTLTMVVAVLYWRLDGVILSLLAPTEDVAVYGLALVITGALGFVSTTFCRTAYPTIAEGYATDRARFRRAVQSGYQLMLVAAAPIAVLGWFVADRVLVLLATPEFADRGAVVLQLFFVACAISFLNALLTQPLFAAGEQGFLVRISLFGLGVNIVLNLALVPSLGAEGTALAMVITELLGTTLSTWRLTRLGVPPVRFGYVLRLLPGLGLGLAALWLVWDAPFAVPALVSAAVYGVSVIVTGALPVQILREVMRRPDRSADEQTEVTR